MRDGNSPLTVSSIEHNWWKNLRGGAPVMVRVIGRDFRGVAEAFEGRAVEDDLLAVLRRVPAYRRYFDVKLDESGESVDPRALARVARANVVVRVRELVPTKVES